MKVMPWVDNSVQFLVKTGPMKGIRIEAIKEPWDLYLEGYLLETTIGSPEHIGRIKEGKERIFSIRNKDREPLADIVCMPKVSWRHDNFWRKLRIFQTSSTMTVNDEKLIVLDILGRKAKRPPKDIIDIAKAFFTSHGGEFKNEYPFGVAVDNEKELRKWQHKCRDYMDWNLCIGSRTSHSEKCQTQTRYPEESIKTLRKGRFDFIYICSDDEWTNKVMDHLENHPLDLPTEKLIFYGADDKNRKAYVTRANGWYKKMTATQWSDIP